MASLNNNSISLTSSTWLICIEYYTKPVFLMSLKQLDAKIGNQTDGATVDFQNSKIEMTLMYIFAQYLVFLIKVLVFFLAIIHIPNKFFLSKCNFYLITIYDFLLFFCIKITIFFCFLYQNINLFCSFSIKILTFYLLKYSQYFFKLSFLNRNLDFL